MKCDKNNLVVMISHPFGEIEIPLQEWMEQGPKKRKLLRPTKLKNKKTNKYLPLNQIPLKYRNTSISRFFIKIGVLENPWKE